MSRYLVVDVGQFRCAFAVADVAETMRPLPLESASGAPEFVLGVSIVRGAAVPVVDLASLLGAETVAVNRFVTFRLRERVVAAAVHGVVGVTDFASEAMHKLPPLLSGAQAEALARHDGELVRVFSAARLLDDKGRHAD